MPTERICMSMILLEPANKINALQWGDQAADHLINGDFHQVQFARFGELGQKH
jgi:hypothetical protein